MERINKENAPQRVYNGIARPSFTPNALSSLKRDEVFVFGSNLRGYHGGGAARAALNKFGAIWGQGVGLQGQSYAIPTMQGGVETIKPYVDQFIAFAKAHPELFFYVTRIGCGIAGFKDCDIAPLFEDAMNVDNICLPESFAKELERKDVPDVPQELLTMMHGQVRTLIDLLKALNKEEPIKDCEDAMNRLSELVERNVRYGDEFAFIAMRTIWCLLSRYREQNKRVDIDQLEKDMMSFHDRFYGLNEDISAIFYGYSVRKIVKYIQLVNEFRRYTSYEQIREDLQSLLPFSQCSENEPDYYFSFNSGTLSDIAWMLRTEWKNVTSRGVLNNEKLESIAFGRFENMVRKHGIKDAIRLAYTDVGCHPDIQGPMHREEGIAWGPVYRMRGNHIEKGCSDFRRWPFTNTSFEMKFAKKLLDTDEHYLHVDNYYVPASDYTLPVFSEYNGKMSFGSEEEKIQFIKELKFGR